MGDRQMRPKEKVNFAIPTRAVEGVLVVGDDWDISEVDIEITRLRASAVVSNVNKHLPSTNAWKSIQPTETLEGNLSIVHQECDECVVFGDSGCVVTCPNHHNTNLPYATSISSSPEPTDTPGSRSSSSTFSNSGLSISNRCSEALSIASSLGLGGGEKGKYKGKGREGGVVPVTVPEQVHRPRTRFSGESTRSRDSSGFGTAERKRVPPSIHAFPPIHPQQVESDPSEISVIPAPGAVLRVDGHPPREKVRGRNGDKMVSFAFPDESEIPRGERRLVAVSAGLGNEYRGNVYKRSGYKWQMLVCCNLSFLHLWCRYVELIAYVKVYLTILNPLICFTNALLTISLLAFLALTYPLQKLATNIRPRPPQSPLPVTTSDTTDTPHPYTLSWNSYFSTNIRNHLSSPLFFHLRIIYQTSQPPPSPDEWDARRLVIVHLSAPVVSLVPCGLAAWGAMLMWVYSVLLGEGDEEGSGGWGAGRRGHGGVDDGRGSSGGEFYALRFVRKQWERWLWSALC